MNKQKMMRLPGVNLLLYFAKWIYHLKGTLSVYVGKREVRQRTDMHGSEDSVPLACQDVTHASPGCVMQGLVLVAHSRLLLGQATGLLRQSFIFISVIDSDNGTVVSLSQ